MKRKDLWVLLSLLAAGLLVFLLSGRALPGAQDTAQTLYLRVSAPDREAELIPLTETRDLVLEQANGERNVVHLFPGGFSMAESNCKNQDCVKQGEVTLQNRAGRPLYDSIICLPHKVTLQLVTEETETLELAP